MAQDIRGSDPLVLENESLRRQIAALELELQRANANRSNIEESLAPGQASDVPALCEKVISHESRRSAVQDAEQRLRESERKYRELVEHANSIILYWTPDGRVEFLNDFGQRFFGYTDAEIRGRHVMGTIVPETETSGRDLRSLMDDVCAAPAAFEQNINENMRRNGERVWIAWTNKVVLDEQGQVARILSIGADITERRRAEQAMRESELKYRTLFETASAAIFLMRQDRFVDCNARAPSMFGCSREQLIGASPYEFSLPLQPDGRPSLDKVLEKISLAMTEGPQIFEWEHCRADRIPFAAEVKLNRLELGGEVMIQARVNDITERKQAEARALHLNRLYATLSRFNQIVMKAVDRDMLFRETCRVAIQYGQFRLAWIGLVDEATSRVNVVAHAGEDNGYLSLVSIDLQDEATGRGPTGLAIRENRCVLCQDIATDPRMRSWRPGALARGFRSSAAVPIRQADKVIGAFMVYSSEPLVFDAEEEALLIEIGHAISYALDALVHEAERRKAEANLRQLNLELEQRVAQRTSELNSTNEQLRARNGELKDFAYTVSHDLKAPLRGIAGYANELIRKHRAGLSDRAQFCLAQVLTATSHLDQLIEDLLQYSRLDAEMPSPSEVHLRDLVDVILRDRDLVINEHCVDVVVDIPFTTIKTWERGLTQVLTNLIDNALKYGRAASPPRLRIAAEAFEGVWRLSVADNGIGFDMKYHDRIFGLFNRLVRMEEYEGNGAGLAIVKKVIDKQGGRVWAEATPGHGATFFVEIPRTRDSE